MTTRKATSRAPLGREVVAYAPAAQQAAAQPTEAKSPAMRKITIDHVSRIAGHAKITIKLDDAGQVTATQVHVPPLRGFEEFVLRRPYHELPSITARI